MVNTEFNRLFGLIGWGKRRVGPSVFYLTGRWGLPTFALSRGSVGVILLFGSRKGFELKEAIRDGPAVFFQSAERHKA